MRCFFIKRGRFVGVQILTGLTEQQAVEKARLLFAMRTDDLDGFELWEGARVVMVQHPAHYPKIEESRAPR